MPAPDSRPIVLTEIVEMGGAERSVLALSRWLHQHNLPNHIVTYRDAVNLATHAGHPVEVVQLNPQMDPLHKVLALKNYFSNLPATAPKPLMSGYQPALHASLGGLRGFHTLMHDTPSLFSDASEQASLKSRLARRTSDRITAHGLRSGGVTIVTSTYLQQETARVFGVQPAIARMGGLASATAFHPRPITDGALRMLSVSRVEANKRIDWLLRALARLEHSNPSLSTLTDWGLDIAGRGAQLEALTALSQSLGIAPRIHFHGFVPDAELQLLYDHAHLFLMPAVQGYGIPAIESLERGIPVLLHRESGVSDILLETPWATVITGDESTLLPALTHAIHSTLTGLHLATPLPPLPTEDTWAEQVATLCHWT